MSSSLTPAVTTTQRVGWMSDDDPENPVNLSLARKIHIILAGTICTLNSGLGTSLPSGASKYISAYFDVTDKNKLVLLNSLFMVGFATGPLLFGPMSEDLGRRPVLIGTYIGFTIFTMACALAPNFASLIIFRLLSGINAAAPMSVVGGLYADIYNHPDARGQAMSFFMYVTTLGPQAGPIISGFISPVSWRWSFWVALISAGIGLPCVALLPETYVPVLLRQRQKRKNKKASENQTGDDVEQIPIAPTMPTRQDSFRTIYTRPFIMMIEEPIVLFTSLYLMLIYSTLYLFFQAYPIIFQGLYGLSAGMAGLANIAVMVGATGSYAAFLWYSPYHAKAEANDKSWARIEEYRRLPLACAGGPLIVVGLFWLGWTSYKSIHPVIPMLSGVWFGMGYLLIFLSMLNYVTDVYKQYSASAQAAASTTRSIAATLLPLATSTMYGNLGIHWASSLLGFVALIMALIPFGFIRYRKWIRANSKFCQELEGRS